MKVFQMVAYVALMASFVSFLPSVQAAEEVEEKSSVQAEKSADDWFYKSESSREKKRDSSKKEKFVWLFSDDTYHYAMDAENVKWILMPHSSKEYIVDVWIRLVSLDGMYSYPQKYFLEHYYLRPDTQQVQFLSELEVTGRPQNNITEREYSSRNWENLISGSVEDEIYHKVMEKIKKEKVGSKTKDRKSVRDWVEDNLNISL